MITTLRVFYKNVALLRLTSPYTISVRRILKLIFQMSPSQTPTTPKVTRANQKPTIPPDPVPSSLQPTTHPPGAPPCIPSLGTRSVKSNKAQSSQPKYHNCMLPKPLYSALAGPGLWELAFAWCGRALALFCAGEADVRAEWAGWLAVLW